MDAAPTLRTARLLLRPWRAADMPAFAALNADSEVMAHFPAPLDRVTSDALVERIRDHFSRHGFGWWALERDATPGLIGTVGLSIPDYETHFTPCVEIGWRLAKDYWGQGFATEAAQAALAFGFETLGFQEIVALTVSANFRSRRVMEQLGMRRDEADDFDHPRLPEGHSLRRHVLYRLRRSGRSVRP